MTKVTFETATLSDAIKKAERIAPSKGQAFDKAAGIVIEIVGPELPVIIRATNLEIFSIEWVDTTEIVGEATTWRIASKIFAQVINSLPIGSGKTVTIESVTKGFHTQLHVTAGRTKARFNLLDIEYYPTWDVFDPDELTPVKDFGGRLALVQWASSNQGGVLSGINLDGEKAVGTDKYKLAVTPLKIEGLAERITVPSEILPQLLKQTGEVSIGREHNMLLIMPDEFSQIRTVLYGEKYPMIDKIMEATYEHAVEIEKVELLDILTRANNFAAGDRIPTLRMFFGQEEIRCAMLNEEVGMLGDVLEVPGYCDHDMWEVKFTPRNIIDAISNCPNSKMTIHYAPERKRALLYIEGGSGYQAWVMPRNETQPEGA